ncbi:MAG: sugar transferase [Butyrivibrio sp.]|nr:sugar transferase [Ruminococcus flavefaciens]MCM1561201.1 sugar transferase [Butyrivibrio sp.]
MKIHITNLYGQPIDSVGQKAQNAVTDIARKELGYNELGIFWYNINADSPQMLSTRLDGIVAGVSNGDIVIFQHPTWNDMRFEEAFIERLDHFKGIKKIFLIHDLPPLMSVEKRPMLGRYISLFNRADSIILPSQAMADLLCSEGLTVKKIVILKMFDYCVDIDHTITPQFKKVINFAGNPDAPKFSFVKEWFYKSVQLGLTASGVTLGRNVSFLGWFRNDNLLTNALRRNGGFGLVWCSDPNWNEYMKLNANYKLSTYLAAGLPLIVSSDIAEKDTIIRKNLGLIVESLDEAVERVDKMTEEQYNKMAADVDTFADLLREGCFMKKALTEAVFRLLYD